MLSLFRKRKPAVIPPTRTRLNLEGLESREVPANFTWTNAGGDGLGTNAANWTRDSGMPMSIPGTADNVTFPAGSASCSWTVGGGWQWASLTMANGYTGTLSLTGTTTWTIGGTSNLNQGTISLNGVDLVVGGGTTTVGGLNSVSVVKAGGSPDVVVSSGATLVSKFMFSDVSVSNSGTFTIPGASSGIFAFTDDAALFSNQTGATLKMGDGGTGASFQVNTGADAATDENVIKNYGTIDVDCGTTGYQTFTCNSYIHNYNTGVLNVKAADTLLLDYQVDANGYGLWNENDVNQSAGSVIKVTAGSDKILSSGTWADWTLYGDGVNAQCTSAVYGSIVFDDGDINLSTNTLRVHDGDVTIKNGADLYVSAFYETTNFCGSIEVDAGRTVTINNTGANTGLYVEFFGTKTTNNDFYPVVAPLNGASGGITGQFGTFTPSGSGSGHNYSKALDNSNIYVW
jgi:hypothetical protein